ncbi:Ig-like domain-containing protein [Rhodothermus profundi]|uniref:Por secretion system C-terminal sorting domain-containing protein n=1 Tax=Rhodothermus profundi TaxID=633813 RepID=A0A1M6VEP9_9BACT|nr:Ig-like domain-containing protein [Rhodothermus profundi]SHK80003.1 Por secretion system C-terminal sorting domain-containing protein [Rhodothermus profundi]
MKRIGFLLGLWWVSLVQAQDLQVVSVSPAHGSAGVALNTPVTITFNKAITLDSLAILPLDTTLQAQLTDPSRISLSVDGKTLTLNVTHEANRDYTWVVHYAKATDGSRLAKRVTFYYTTASSAGPHTISGQIVESGTASQAAPLRLPALRAVPVAATSAPPHARASVSAAVEGTALPALPTSLPPTTQANHLGNWYVALFSTPTPEDEMPVRLAVTNPDGSFSIDYVRPGTYYLWAYLFGPDARFEIPRGFGTYDANGDGAADALNVTGNLSNLTVPVVFLGATRVSQAASVAQAVFPQAASDAQIVFIVGNPDNNGRSLFWYFVAYSAQQQKAYSLTVTSNIPLGSPQELRSPAPYDQMSPINLQSMKDSDVILNAFLTRFPITGDPDYRQMMAGQLYPFLVANDMIHPDFFPLSSTTVFWLILEGRRLPSPLQGTADYSGAYDLSTGTELLTTQPLTAFRALQIASTWLAPSKQTQQADGVVSFSSSFFNPYDGTASTWTINAFAGGLALQLTLTDSLLLRVDTLNQQDWATMPKIPFPQIVDSDQAADTARANNAATFLSSRRGPVFASMEGGFLGPVYNLNVDPSTPLYGLFLFEAGAQAAKRTPLQPAQATARYFVHMQTGAFIGSSVQLPHTARARLQAVQDSAKARSQQAELKRIWSQSVGPLGVALDWKYDYYVPGDSAQLEVTATPGQITVARHQPPEIALAGWPTLPEPFIDSDRAMSTAMANGGSQFMAAHPQAMIFMEGRAMPDRYPHLSDRYIWEVRFLAPAAQGKAPGLTAQQDSLIVLIDMQTGEVLPLTVSNEPLPDIAVLRLDGVYPNPASRQVFVVLQVPQPERLRLTVYNLLGQEVARLLDGPVPAGTHRIRWSVTHLPAGLYLLRLEGSQRTDTRSLVITH